MVGVAIAATIKKAASGHVPHIVDADNDGHCARQRLQPTGNVEPVGHRVQMDNVNIFQFLACRRWQKPASPMPRLARERH